MRSASQGVRSSPALDKSPAARDATSSRAAPATSFPLHVDEFAADGRVALHDGQWLLFDDHGAVWEFDDKVHQWFPSVDGEKSPRAAAVPDAHAAGPAARDKETAKKAAPGNRAIYVSNLPLDASLHELEETFGRYGGLIDEGADGRKRITMYKDSQGKFKGDALVVFFRPESVPQAIKLLDDGPFRPGDVSAPRLKIVEADASYKKSQGAHLDAAASKPSASRASKKQRIDQVHKMNQKLAEWEDDDLVLPAMPIHSNRWRLVVIMKHMFTLNELERDPSAILDIKEDIREQAETCGLVTNVILYDQEPAGIASVRFKDPAAAEAFVTLTNGRMFDGRRVESFVATERPKFKKSRKDMHHQAHNESAALSESESADDE